MELTMKRLANAFYVFGLSLFLMANVNCKGKTEKNMNQETQEVQESKSVSISKTSYGTTQDGIKVDQFLLKNEGGIEADIITYGGRITALRTPIKTAI